MSRIIALTGAKGCGKDTVATILQAAYHRSGEFIVRQIAFADPIKDQVMKLFELNSIDEYDRFKRTHINYQLQGYFSHAVPARHLVREIGMLMRHYDEEQFVRYVVNKINSTRDDMLWVVTDLRFDNELKAMKELGAKIVKIVRPEVTTADNHITERGFDDAVCDIVINNTSTLETFNRQVLEVFDNKLMEWKWL